MSGDTSGCHDLRWVCTIGILCVKARAAAPHPRRPRVALTATDDLAPDVNGVAVETLFQ